MEQYLTLWLEGPLQAWGYDSRFDIRRTLGFPTRSGLSGLLLAALGASGEQCDLLGKLAEFPLTVYSFANETTPVLEDFHMVGNGYGDSEWEKLMSPKTADGKTPVGGGAKLTYRHFLVDRHFAAVWKMPEEFAGKFSSALQQPVFELYLGRKCCVPAEFIFQGIFDTETEALAKLRELSEKKGLNVQWAYREVSLEEIDEDTLLLNDVPLRFGIHKIYRERSVRKEPVCFENHDE